jgi:protein tyrosine phosphatase
VLMQQLDEAIDFVKHHINPKKAHDLNYLLWVLFNQINDIDEITEIKTNLLKLHSKH